ncbi:metallophosphoesterase [Clostridium sp. Mt-5]|uniref:Metallophosphoesterase n=1 Tax=Clostridium moutaii TaxID=3240932 RepID=A0ABV4BQQ2_9CLOT
MKKFRINRLLFILILVICFGFLICSFRHFKVDKNFSSIPLNFNPSGSISSYVWNGSEVAIKGGFVKGKTIDNRTENLILRSISPTPEISIRANSKGNKTFYLRLENINPVDTNFSNIEKNQVKIIDSHTVALAISLKANEEKTIKAVPKDNTDGFEFVMLGDNRDGYQTFSQILDQINAIDPAFTVDDGDLVFGGEPHKYRLFYESVAKLKVPLYTTLGNHDIRENGRPTYTKLFGPPYYSFDYKNVHLVFLDSSRGFTEKVAIPEEQYKWLENDLKSAKGKLIFVFSHIPPSDPRKYVDANTLPNISDEERPGLIERIMNNYSQYKSLNHGFPDQAEAKRFENIMTKYHVHTVFLSHIHSYFSYIKDNVRYVISGGGGAELLTTNSYYHYLRVKVTNEDTYLEAIELPSPANKIQDRYIAAVQLFAKAIYKEYKTTVISILIIILSIIAWILWNTRNKWERGLLFWVKFLSQVFRTSITIYKQLKEDIFKKR